MNGQSVSACSGVYHDGGLFANVVDGSVQIGGIAIRVIPGTQYLILPQARFRSHSAHLLPHQTDLETYQPDPFPSQECSP